MSKFMAVFCLVLGAGAVAAAYQFGRASEDCPQPQSLGGGEEVLGIINEYRLQNNLQPLQTEIHLTAAAQWFAEDIYTHGGRLNHTDSLGRHYKQRLGDFGYSTNTWLVENLGIAQDSLQAFETWRLSPPHNVNLLNDRVNEVGIGVAGNIWVFDAGEAVAPPPLITSASTPATPEPVLVLTPEPLPEVTPCRS